MKVNLQGRNQKGEKKTKKIPILHSKAEIPLALKILLSARHFQTLRSLHDTTFQTQKDTKIRPRT